MAGGINISIAEAAALSVVSVAAGAGSISDVLNSVGITTNFFGPYRDKAQNNPNPTYSITVPQTYDNKALLSSNATYANSVNGGYTLQGAGVAEHSNAPDFFVFDAVLVASHSKRWTPTRKPIQSGYNISDHIIKEQPTIVLEIGMSDAMTAYKTGMWTANASKSISCWQQINAIADSRQLVTLATRQETYTNMAIVAIESSETNATVKSLKARITFQQMLLANSSTLAISARPNATDSTALGTQQNENVPLTIVQQHEIIPSDLPVGNSNSTYNTNGIPAGGQFSSNLLNN